MSLDAYRQLCASKRPKPLLEGLQKTPAMNSTLFAHQSHGVEFRIQRHATDARTALNSARGFSAIPPATAWAACSHRVVGMRRGSFDARICEKIFKRAGEVGNVGLALNPI